jgi:dTDP-glucose pyrophosphorylase
MDSTDQEFRESILAVGASIRDAATLLQRRPIKIALICDADGLLLGTVTDGDLRRSIVAGFAPEDPVSKVMNAKPLVAGPTDHYWAIQARMRENLIHAMPQVDEEGRLINLHGLHGSGDVEQLPNTIVLMAGGKGIRLRPLTDNIPKPLLMVGSKPVLQHSIEHFISQGFNKFIISVNYLGHMIEEHFGDGSRWNVEIEYVREDKPMGTAGALSLMPLQEHPFAVVNGDILTKANVSDHLQSCNDDVLAVIGVREHSHTVPYGCVDLKDGLVAGLSEKPTTRYLINTGMYVLSPAALSYLPRDSFFNMTSLIDVLLLENKRVKHFLVTEEWIDIGSVEDLSWSRRLYATEA